MGIILNEKQYCSVMKKLTEWRKYDDFKSYREEYPEETYEYQRENVRKTGLNVDVFLDCYESYKTWKHPLWVYVVNGYTKECRDYLPMSVCSNPKVLLKNYKLNITEEDLSKVKAYIIKNYESIVKLANRKIDGVIDYKSKPVIINENKSFINEMATLNKKITGLPTEIWVDQGTNPQHGPRIKFKASDEQKTTRDFSTMTVDEINPYPLNLPTKKCKISRKEIKILQAFVRYNTNNLKLLAQGLIDLDEFIDNMVRIKPDGSPIFPEKWFPIN